MLDPTGHYGDVSRQLVREQTRHVQRIQKTLTEANIRLDSVLSDIMGASGRRMIEAMNAGVRDPRNWRLWPVAGSRPRRRNCTMRFGRLTDHHRFLLRLHLGQWDALSASIRIVDDEVDARVARMDTEARAAIRLDFLTRSVSLSRSPGSARCRRSPSSPRSAPT
jgi:transposase